MPHKLRIAACQFPVSHDVARNAKFIRRFMRKAAGAKADVIHFPETALPGYGNEDLDRQFLEERTKQIADRARELEIWVVLGSCREIAGKKPSNCIRVISNTGQMIGTYDKRKLTPAETDWYTPGKNGPLVVDINGIKCGFLICHELCFPDLFEAYRQQGIQVVFHSGHCVSRKPQPALEELALAQVRTRAADNAIWISGSDSSARHSFSTARIARPDGSVRLARKHSACILLHDLPDNDVGWTYDNRK
jgi:predicted amidohydrolase